MIRALFSLTLAVAFAFQGMAGCAVAEAAVAAPQSHCAEMAKAPDDAVHHMAPDDAAPHDCKHSCHVPAVATPAMQVAEPQVLPQIEAVTAFAARHGGHPAPATPPPRSA
ncbi:MAG TPA: hypothetical protein PKD99_10425 [Sphingopyxis sp.]|nr:hypothetical protein [Sphingopyxis sp.]HMP45510.1 hypothetical protein [Sphingopyxis sp.]HMQ20053.1 hypothetical protein [Sphingopyxis sp.]